MPLIVTPSLSVPDDEIELRAVRAQGPGGQHVNKVSTAVRLRFDIHRSSLPEPCKRRLLALGDARISHDGVVTIKAQRFRSRERNREDALERLAELIRRAARPRKPRVPTRPTRGAKERRLREKKRRGGHKRLRGPVRELD